ncbi:hypothetical protein BC829DRAFT_394945 [Chytridium lagenaria]|nr:hypothetical protein BC829DRAFT_394945 [Chytridium lagenaria]
MSTPVVSAAIESLAAPIDVRNPAHVEPAPTVEDDFPVDDVEEELEFDDDGEEDDAESEKGETEASRDVAASPFSVAIVPQKDLEDEYGDEEFDVVVSGEVDESEYQSSLEEREEEKGEVEVGKEEEKVEIGKEEMSVVEEVKEDLMDVGMELSEISPVEGAVEVARGVEAVVAEKEVKEEVEVEVEAKREGEEVKVVVEVEKEAEAEKVEEVMEVKEEVMKVKEEVEVKEEVHRVVEVMEVKKEAEMEMEKVDFEDVEVLEEELVEEEKAYTNGHDEIEATREEVDGIIDKIFGAVVADSADAMIQARRSKQLHSESPPSDVVEPIITRTNGDFVGATEEVEDAPEDTVLSPAPEPAVLPVDTEVAAREAAKEVEAREEEEREVMAAEKGRRVLLRQADVIADLIFADLMKDAVGEVAERKVTAPVVDVTAPTVVVKEITAPVAEEPDVITPIDVDDLEVEIVDDDAVGEAASTFSTITTALTDDDIASGFRCVPFTPSTPRSALDRACANRDACVRDRCSLVFDAVNESLEVIFAEHDAYENCWGSGGVSRGLRCLGLRPRAVRVGDMRRKVVELTHGENLDALLIGEVREDERRWKEMGVGWEGVASETGCGGGLGDVVGESLDVAVGVWESRNDKWRSGMVNGGVVVG